MQDGDEKRPTGRISNENHKLIGDAFEEIIAIAKRVAQQTGLIAGQIFDQWTATRMRKHLKKNMWNAYGRYFKANYDTEVARIPSGESTAVTRLLFPADFSPSQSSGQVGREALYLVSLGGRLTLRCSL